MTSDEIKHKATLVVRCENYPGGPDSPARLVEVEDASGRSLPGKWDEAEDGTVVYLVEPPAWMELDAIKGLSLLTLIARTIDLAAERDRLLRENARIREGSARRSVEARRMEPVISAAIVHSRSTDQLTPQRDSIDRYVDTQRKLQSAVERYLRAASQEAEANPDPMPLDAWEGQRHESIDPNHIEVAPSNQDPYFYRLGKYDDGTLVLQGGFARNLGGREWVEWTDLPTENLVKLAKPGT